MNIGEKSYRELTHELREIALLRSVSSVLGWDERTQLPPSGAEHRSNQMALMAKLEHQRFTAPKIGELLSAVDASGIAGAPESDIAVNLRESKRAYDRARKLPDSLVEERTKTEVLAQHAWVEARKKSDYSAFAPWLEKILALKKEEASLIGYAKHAYDTLLDEFEPGDTTEDLKSVFQSLRDPLVDLIRRIGAAPRQAPAEILERKYPPAAQEKLAREAAAAVGFDFTAGRLDVSVHPFCTGLGPGDTRMTTRYDENYFGDAFFGVGRSRSFWTFFLPKARAAFPESLAGVTDDDWYRAINDVRPSFIRTESDEATYNLHILLRFELEAISPSPTFPRLGTRR
jgi:carboxypeptidase Taq